jgi:hypothetical protein
LPKNPRTTTVELCTYATQAKEMNAELQHLDVERDLQMAIKRIENKQKRLLSGEIGFSGCKSLPRGAIYIDS